MQHYQYCSWCDGNPKCHVEGQYVLSFQVWPHLEDSGIQAVDTLRSIVRWRAAGLATVETIILINNSIEDRDDPRWMASMYCQLNSTPIWRYSMVCGQTVRHNMRPLPGGTTLGLVNVHFSYKALSNDHPKNSVLCRLWLAVFIFMKRDALTLWQSQVLICLLAQDLSPSPNLT
jgi:hypothetical protein